MKRSERLFVCALSIVIAGLPAAAHAQEDERAQHVYEIFRNRCFGCDGEKHEAGLDLRTDAALKAESAKGPVVVPHRPEQIKDLKSRGLFDSTVIKEILA